MKLLVRVPFSDEKVNELKQYFDEIIVDSWTKTGERYYEDEMLKVLKEVKPDAIITELDRITEKVLSGYDGLKFIGDCRATPANIEIDACDRHGVPVLCTPGRNTQAVAEMVVGLLLCFMRNIISANKWEMEGKWVQGTTPYYLHMGNELNRKKVGLVGMGQIARVVAKILEAFGCDIYFYDPFVKNADPKYHQVDLDKLFEISDIVSIHVPPMESTRGMITESLFKKMKKTAIFVNAARSMIIDSKALYNAIESKSIAGAIIDVLDNEPPTEDDLKIGKFSNVLMVPHICGATYEVSDHQADIIVERIHKWFKKEDMDKIVYNLKK